MNFEDNANGVGDVHSGSNKKRLSAELKDGAPERKKASK
jgi:hypothetical protein